MDSFWITIIMIALTFVCGYASGRVGNLEDRLDDHSEADDVRDQMVGLRAVLASVRAERDELRQTLENKR